MTVTPTKSHKKYVHFRDLDTVDKSQIITSYIIRIIILILFFVNLYEKQYFLSFLTAFFLLLTFVPSIIERNYKVILPLESDFFLTLFIFMSVILGDIHGAYQVFWWWDIFLHTLSGTALGLVGFTIAYLLVEYSEESRLSSTLFISFAFGFAVTIGVMWEFIEFIIDNTTSYVMQHSLQNTMKDLAFDAVGGVVAAIMVYLYLTNKKRFGFMRRVLRKVVQKQKYNHLTKFFD